ncbi:hypothetical protein [Rhizobium laguerreae]|nr:hypothetical protein [Rhizobium laguerreae]
MEILMSLTSTACRRFDQRLFGLPPVLGAPPQMPQWLAPTPLRP